MIRGGVREYLFLKTQPLRVRGLLSGPSGLSLTANSTWDSTVTLKRYIADT
jgi:hypothetical protein